MPELKTLRNVAIIVAIAFAVYLIPGGGRAASTFEAALVTAFALGIGYLLVRLYREHRIAIHGLGDRHRALLYAAIVAGAFDVLARARMWESGIGELAWFVLLGLIVYAVMAVVRRWRSY
jgi:hypothetical protein